MEKIRCDHCHLSYDKNMLIEDVSFGTPKFFCCKGCQGVYHLLADKGFESFYEKMGSGSIEPPKKSLENLDKFDMDGFRKKYIKQTDGFCEISLIIEGIHCAACVWLNEKVLHRADGVIEASVNGASHKAKIVWDDEVIKLSQIIALIGSIGYSATPYDPNLQESYADARKKEYYARLLVALFASMNIMWIAIAQYAGYFTGMRDDVKSILNFAEFVLATPALFYTGWTFYRGAYYGLKNRFINMDFLVVAGASLAYIYSIYSMFSGHGEVYFDSVTMIITFVFAGKYLEVLTQKRATDTLDSLSSSLPTEVVVVKNFGLSNQEKTLTAVEEIVCEDILELKAGDKVVIDGVIVAGEGAFDESSLTGESKPVQKGEHSAILSGSLCLDARLYYKATNVFKDSMLSKIILLLEDSLSKKPRIEQLANKISGYFSLAIFALGLMTFAFWYLKNGSFEHALIVAISVIVIACPCALGLATPVSTLVGLGVASKKGVLFKEASFLESMAKTTHLVLDKTGTLTKGKPQVVKEKQYKEFDVNILYSLLKSSTHPVSKGVLEHLEKTHENLQELPLEGVKTHAAKGVEAVCDKRDILGGNGKLLALHGIEVKPELENSEYIFVLDKEIVASFTLEDALRAEAKGSLESIETLGIKTLMLTGDNEGAALKVAKALHVKDVKYSLLPIDKANEIDMLHEKKRVVTMVGDGINDTLALSKSDVAIAMGSGADVALSASDVVLLHDNLHALQEAFLVAKRTYKTIKQNLSFSLFYNAITIPLAIMGYVTPLIAALSMSLSSLVVVLNSLSIKLYCKDKR